MTLNKLDIEKFGNQYDILALAELVPVALSSSDPSDINLLADKIDGILNEWSYDFSCKKGGDPRDYPFREGLQALHQLLKRDLFYDEVDYLLHCGDYCVDYNDLVTARDFFLQASKRLNNRLDSCPEDSRAYSRLVSTYDCFPAADEVEKVENFEKALRVIETRFIPDNKKFYHANLDFLYRRAQLNGFQPRISNLREQFFKLCIEKALDDSLFALEMATNLHYWLRYPHDPLPQDFSSEIIQILEAASRCVSRREKFDLVTAGHVFAKEGARFQRLDFLLTAETLFERALTEPNAFSLVHVYIADNKIQQALLAEKSGELRKAQVLRDTVKNRYLQDWKTYQNDISYLSHATEFLCKDAIAQLEMNPDNSDSKKLLRKVIEMAQAAERAGQAGYWFPYEHLIQAHLGLNEIAEVKFWLARGYRALNMLVEEKIKKFLAQLIENRSPDELIQFVKKIVFHLDQHIDKSFWPGGPQYEELSSMTLAEIENWMIATAQNSKPK